MKASLTHVPATPETSFRLRLQSELARRCARNTQYSLRAFAMHLGVDHSTLSQWLRGRRPITAPGIASIGAALGLDGEAIRRYTDGAGRELPIDPAREFQLLSADTLEMAGEWYHLALLELTHLPEFRADTRWIGRVLDISADEVNVALQRLLRLGLIEMTGAGWIDLCGPAIASLDGVSPSARARMDDGLHRKARAAIERTPIVLHDRTSMTLAISRAALPAAFDLAARFRRDLAALLQDGPPDDVYCVEIAMFPLTTLARPKE